MARVNARNKSKKLQEEKAIEIVPSDDDEDEETGNQKPKKSFLKRRSKAVQEQKVNWDKVGARVNCWSGGGPGAERESVPRPTKKVVKTNKLPWVKKTVKSRIDSSLAGSPQIARTTGNQVAHGYGYESRRPVQSNVSNLSTQDLENVFESNYSPKLIEILKIQTKSKEDSSTIPKMTEESNFVTEYNSVYFASILQDLNDHLTKLTHGN